MLIQRIYQKLIPNNSPDRFKIIYLLLAAVCLTTILAASVVVLNWNSAEDLKDTVIAHSERIVDAIFYTEVDAILIRKNDRGDYTITLNETARDLLDGRIRDMFDPLNIVRVLIFDGNRAPIYGNNKKNMAGSDMQCDVKDAFEKGEIVCQLRTQQTIVDLVGEKREQTDLAEVSVPIRHKNGQIMGVFTVYSDVSKLTQKYKQQMRNSMLAQTIMLLLISFVSYIVIIRESSELKRAYQKLESLATTDSLTGISNRRQLLERIEQHFAMLQRSGTTVSGNVGLGVVMIDVDYFKQINDTYGHLAGDSILQELAKEINQVLRQYDVFGRYGGEEFLIVFPNTLPEEAKRIAQRLITSVRERPFIWDDSVIHITLSGGVTWTDASNETLDEVLSKVDGLMYEAKESGRDRIIFRV